MMNVRNNQMTIVGQLLEKPELKEFGGDSCVAKFTIISDNKAKKAADGTYDRPALFLNCEAWGLDGRKAFEHLDKGSLVQLRGQLYYDEVGEEKRRYWALTVNDFWLISKVQYTKPEENTEKPKEDATKAPAKTRKPKNNGTTNDESKPEPKQEHDIPF